MTHRSNMKGATDARSPVYAHRMVGGVILSIKAGGTDPWGKDGVIQER